jgi:hypothetical protein
MRIMRLAVVVGIVLSVTAANADAQWCYMQRVNEFYGSSVDTNEVTGSGKTLTTSAFQPSSYQDYWWCPTGNPGYTEFKVWVEGRATSNWGCPDRTGSTNFPAGVCQSYGNNGGVQHVVMDYFHNTSAVGWWGNTTQHFWHGTWTQVWNNRYYSISPSYECSQRGQPWYWNGSECIDGGGSPIILPLYATKDDDKTKYKLTGKAVSFDIDGDGDMDLIGWTAKNAGLAFLAIDRNKNGLIDNGTELFGTHTLAGAANGFEALDMLETQAGDGRRNAIDAADSIYAKLLLWEDRNADGVSQPEELSAFSALYSAIGTGYSFDNGKDAFGNRFAIQGWAEMRTQKTGRNAPKDGKESEDRTRRIYDVIFVR